jgi:hypothetical protein
MNLAVRAHEKLPNLDKIEAMLGDIYSYFCKSPKKYMEFFKLAEVMETMGLKILWNIKTRWISMLSSVVRIMNEYRTLIVKMHQDTTLKNAKQHVKNATICYDHLADIQIVMGLVALMPMLRLAKVLIKFAQSNEAFVCDFLAAVQVCNST